MSPISTCNDPMPSLPTQKRLKLHVLGSGSKGNCAIVEDAATGKGVMIDCGLCKRDVFTRAKECGFNLEKLLCILITHEHTDHTKGLTVVTRGLAKLGMKVPLLSCEGVLGNSKDIAVVVSEGLASPLTFEPERSFKAGNIEVTPFATSHDAAASVGFRLATDDDALGYVTDTGFLTSQAYEHLQNVRILALESNHDPRMLADGPYPFAVKRRIASDLGHLSNQQSAEALETLLCDRLEHVIAMHVSQNNNEYRLARNGLQEVVERCGHSASVQVAFQERAVSLH